MICSRSSGAPAGGRERDHVPDHLRRVRGVVHQRLRADRDLVAEERGDLVRVARAADVAQQRDPVDGVAHLRVESGLVAHPHGEQARPQLGLERLPERVVLRQREGGDQLTHPERRRGRHGLTSRYTPAPGSRRIGASCRRTAGPDRADYITEPA